MEKFLKVMVPKVSVDSGTTTAGTADKLTQSGQNFTATVSVGDIIVDADNNVYKVLAVDSDTVLSVDGGGVPTSKAYTIYDGNVDLFGEKLISATGIKSIVQTNTKTVTIAYGGVGTTADVVTVHHNAVDAESNYMAESIQDAVIKALSKPWNDVAPAFSFRYVIGSVVAS